MISIIIVISALVFGGLCILSVCFVYIRGREFGVGGIFLTLFGVLLLGSSLWSSAKISIGADGGVVTEFVGSLGLSTAEFNKRIGSLETEVAVVREIIEKVGSSNTETQQQIKSIESKNAPTKEFIENGNISVLVFNKTSQESVAKRLTDRLLAAGFQSSATQTDLTEAKQQFSPGTAWIVWQEGKRDAVERVMAIIADLPNPPKIEVRPDPYELRHGDIQIMLF